MKRRLLWHIAMIPFLVVTAFVSFYSLVNFWIMPIEYFFTKNLFVILEIIVMLSPLFVLLGIFFINRWIRKKPISNNKFAALLFGEGIALIIVLKLNFDLLLLALSYGRDSSLELEHISMFYVDKYEQSGLVGVFGTYFILSITWLMVWTLIGRSAKN